MASYSDKIFRASNEIFCKFGASMVTLPVELLLGEDGCSNEPTGSPPPPGVDTPPRRDGSGVGLTDCGTPFCRFDNFFLDKSQDARLTYSSQRPRVDPLFLCSVTTTVTTGGQRLGRIFNLAKALRLMGKQALNKS